MKYTTRKKSLIIISVTLQYQLRHEDYVFLPSPIYFPHISIILITSCVNINHQNNFLYVRIPISSTNLEITEKTLSVDSTALDRIFGYGGRYRGGHMCALLLLSLALGS